VTWLLHWLAHVLGADYGLPYGHFSFYDFESGSGSDLGEVAIVGGLLSVYRRHNCHVHGCWRVGRHKVAGTDHVVCRRHHPDDPLTHQDLLDQAKRG
jgi:hypothetical protein